MGVAETLANDRLVQYCPTCGCSFAARYDRCPDDHERLLELRDDRLIGRTLGNRFRIVRALGRGATSMVYEGVQLSVDRPVAIKIIASPHPEAARRFMREARVLTSIVHPNVVEVYDFGRTDEGIPYLVMELVRGRTLEAELARAGRMAPRRAVEIAVQLCDALAAAHRRDTIHRDLKPANVILVDGLDDRVKVLDFGIAKVFGDDPAASSKITGTGVMVGTPLYMAPEAITGTTVDARTDLYALGCMLHELLAGAPPFEAVAAHSVFEQHVHQPPPSLPDDVPAALRALVTELLAKLPEQRPASANHLRERLAAVLVTTAIDSEEALTVIHRPSQPVRPSRPSAPPAQPERPSAPPARPTRAPTLRGVVAPPAAAMAAGPALSPATLRAIVILSALLVVAFCVVAFVVP